jgi:predicted lipid carrier protein YhbT
VRFSYLSSALDLISIAPVKNIPLQRVVNRLLSDVKERLPDCRRSWWLMRRTTCLANQWAVVGEPGRIALLAKPTQSAKQIAEAQYDPANEQLHVVFRDGTTEEVKLR